MIKCQCSLRRDGMNITTQPPPSAHDLLLHVSTYTHDDLRKNHSGITYASEPPMSFLPQQQLIVIASAQTESTAGVSTHHAAGHLPSRPRAPCVWDGNGSLGYSCGAPLVSRVLTVVRSLLGQPQPPHKLFTWALRLPSVVRVLV